jgi:hypothetical protein
VKTNLIVRVDPQQKTALSQAAAREGVTPSFLVRKMLAAHLSERQSDKIS